MDPTLITDFSGMNMGEPSGPAPPPPPPPGAPVQNGDSGSGGPPPPPPPPPPGGLGLGLPTYKQMQEQNAQGQEKDLTAKLSGGKKTDAKPFSYGITAADLMNPSAIKKANAARAAAEGLHPGESGSRPTTPSFPRRPSTDNLANHQLGNTLQLQPPNMNFPKSPQSTSPIPPPPPPSFSSPAELRPPGSGRSSLNESPLPRSVNASPMPTFQSEFHPSPSPTPAWNDEPYSTTVMPPVPQRTSSSTPLYNSVTPQRPQATTYVQPAPRVEYGNANVYNEFAGSPPQTQYTAPSQTYYNPQAQMHQSQSPVQSNRINSSPYYEDRNDGLSNGASPTPYNASRASAGLRSRSNSMDRSGQPTKAAVLLEQIRSNYSGSPSSPVRTVIAQEPTSPSPTFARQSSLSGAQNQPSYTSYDNRSYSPAGGRSQPAYNQPQYEFQPPQYGRQNSGGNQGIPRTINSQNYRQSPQAPDPTRTLPFASFVTPSNLEFAVSDPFWDGFGPSSQSRSPQPSYPQQNQYRSEFTIPVQIASSPTPGYGSNQRLSYQQPARAVQIQYSSVANNQNTYWNGGSSDF